MTTFSKALGIGAAVFGLALLIESGLPTAALAAGQSPTGAQQIQGRVVHASMDRDCVENAAPALCRYQIDGIGISDRGELIDLSIVGTEYGDAEKPGEIAPNSSLAVWHYPDGSSMVLKSEGKGMVADNGQHGFSGSQVCVDGSGRFADVDCTIHWQHAVQPNGLYVGSYIGTVTPKAQS
ncbi:MAG: hypothetical protein AAF495_26080 [Pseudomonadota bacterium]